MKSTLVVLTILCGSLSIAQQPAPLTAEQILEKNLEATGGRAAWSQVKTVVKSGTSVSHQLLSKMSPGPTPTAEQSGTIRIYVQPPDRLLYYRSNPNLGLSYEGCYRYTRWSYVPMHGIRYASGEYKNCSSELVPEKWSDWYDKMELKGTKTVNGRKAYEIRVSRHGQDSTLSFDAENFLLLRSSGIVAIGGWAEVAHQIDYFDYGEVDGLKFAYTQVESFNGGQSRTHFGAIYVNAKIADRIFEPENNNHDPK